ncbi:hypothetical protein [Clostridium sp.]|uniref:hypothetical protein n=1 Tax=Clostridium sp. TaxID=1506 RepID=UPI0028526F2C|nr:hypothetical protein [Clostridium sp.]
MDNLPNGIEILFIYSFTELHCNEIYSNLPSSLKCIYVRALMFGNREHIFSKLPFGCEIKRINLKREHDYNFGEKCPKRRLVYTCDKDDNLFKNPVYGYSNAFKTYVKVPFKKEYDTKEYDTVEYEYSVSFDFLESVDIA